MVGKITAAAQYLLTSWMARKSIMKKPSNSFSMRSTLYSDACFSYSVYMWNIGWEWNFSGKNFEAIVDGKLKIPQIYQLEIEFWTKIEWECNAAAAVAIHLKSEKCLVIKLNFKGFFSLTLLPLLNPSPTHSFSIKIHTHSHNLEKIHAISFDSYLKCSSACMRKSADQHGGEWENTKKSPWFIVFYHPLTLRFNEK